MVKPFNDLRAKMSPERREANRQQSQELIVALELADLRKRMGLSQKELAERLNVQQPAVAKVESRPDLHVSTLREHIEAMGGRLELVAKFPDESIMLKTLSSADDR